MLRRYFNSRNIVHRLAIVTIQILKRNLKNQHFNEIKRRKNKHTHAHMEIRKKIIIENKETNDSRKSRLDMNQTTQRSVEY